MASTLDFVEFAAEQVRGTGEVTYKKMFGEYLIYVDGRPILLVCENTVYIKQLPPVEALLADAPVGIPYGGSKNHWILDIDDRDLAHRVVEALLPVVPLPKPKKKKTVEKE